MIDITFTNLYTFLLVLVRMGGMIFFNPLFQRNNVPSQVKTGLVFCLAILLTPIVDYTPLLAFDEFDLVFAMFKELFIGFVCGFVFQIFYYLLFLAGDYMDTQFGISMAKVFDPGSNVQMSMTGSILSLMFMLYIFATDSHLILIKIFSASYDIIPAGVVGIQLQQVSQFMITLFTSAFLMIVKLIAPFAVAEFVIEVSMGILMKIIPQIHVFVINIQVKLAVGITLLLLFAPIVSSFVDNYLVVMLENMQRALAAFV